jgi:hypothetical protein
MKFDKENKFLRRMTCCVLGTVALGTVLAAAAGTAAAAAVPPTLSITRGPYHDGQLINLSVGPNHYFQPYSRIIIIECADPGGKSKNLPTNVQGCDGNTVQGNTVLVQRNGSFSERGYQVYALPNASQLGETTDARPVCSGKHSCVLYIGQNQEKFTDPKIWSPAFTVSKSGRH